MKDTEDRIINSDRIIYAISCLTDVQKIVVLATMLGYTQTQIGEILGVSQQTVSVVLREGKLILRGTLW